MIRLNLAAYIVYIWVALFALSSHAADPSALSKLPKRVNAKQNSSLLLQQNSQAEKLILINQDIKKNLQALPAEGPRTGGGGNSCALVIVKNTELLQKYVQQFDLEGLSSENKDVLQRAIDRAKFYTTSSIAFDGQSKDAANYPDEDKIVLTNRFCRSEMVEVSGRAMSLLMHEYLGLAKIDDRKYQISGKFLEAYHEMSEQKSEVKYYLENEVRKDLAGKPSCFRGAIFKRFEERDVEIAVAEAAESYSAYDAKYCDEPVNGQRVCDNTDRYNYIVTARSFYARSGDFTTLALGFKVEKAVRGVLVVKDSAEEMAEKEDVISSKVTTTYTCTPLKVNLDF